jgi:hypothetical protein
VSIFGVGGPELLILGLVIPIPIAIGIFAAMVHRRARGFGYASTWGYLQAAPRSDAEKRDAVDLALKGLACCVLGLLFPPFLLIGLLPLFYGGRKVVYASMGLGLIDDADQADA